MICLLILIAAVTWPPVPGLAAQDGARAGATGWVPFFGCGLGSKKAHILDMYALPDLGTVSMSFWTYNAASNTWSKLKPKVALRDTVFTLREGLPVRSFSNRIVPDAAFLSGEGRADLMWSSCHADCDSLAGRLRPGRGGGAGGGLAQYGGALHSGGWAEAVMGVPLPPLSGRGRIATVVLELVPDTLFRAGAQTPTCTCSSNAPLSEARARIRIVRVSDSVVAGRATGRVHPTIGPQFQVWSSVPPTAPMSNWKLLILHGRACRGRRSSLRTYSRARRSAV